MAETDVCVIFNQRAGRGRAKARFERLREVLGARADFRETRGAGHGEELAREAAKAGFPRVAAAGGDGTVHEVACGILSASRPETILEVYPLGSANDYAYTLGLDPEWRTRADPRVQVQTVDVGAVSSPDGRQCYFVNGIGIGINGIVNEEARRLPWLQGLALYGTALLRAMCFRYDYPPMVVEFDGRQRHVQTLALTLAIGRREGNFIMAPDAVLDDGLFDYLHAGPMPRLELLWNVPRLAIGWLPERNPHLWRGRCRHVRVSCEHALPFHVDGESFTDHEKLVHALDIQVLPGALRVMARRAAPVYDPRS
ncbi:MAG TPA: diacylglycerol kinase family protein [Gemmataceae bacterium]|nr:diacylglycerol kinase family protein [Gemmataceae bacterium]